MLESMLPPQQPPLYLTVAKGPWAGTLIPMKGPQFLIGRGPNCHLRPTSTKVEDYHCGIFIRAGRFFLRDIRSYTGTYLNDRQVFGIVELLDGDQLRVGPLQFRVSFSSSRQLSAAEAVSDLIEGAEAKLEPV